MSQGKVEPVSTNREIPKKKTNAENENKAEVEAPMSTQAEGLPVENKAADHKKGK